MPRQQHCDHTLPDEKALARAVAQLGAQCATMRAIHARTGLPPLREFTADFAGLARIVTGQQLSASSAAAIWNRLSAAVSPFEPAHLLSLSDAELKAPGLSSGKIRTLRVVATESAEGHLDFKALNALDNERIVKALTALHGIGPWTAEIYLLFALRRADAFPASDLALQLATQRLLRLDDRPTPARMIEIARRWQPFRGAAARLLWADYALHQSTGRAAPPRAPAKARKAI